MCHLWKEKNQPSFVCQMTIEFPVLPQLRALQFWQVNPLHRSVMWDGVLIPVLQTGNWGTRAKSCPVLPGPSSSAKWRRPWFSQQAVILDFGRVRELTRGAWQEPRWARKAAERAALCQTPPAITPGGGAARDIPLTAAQIKGFLSSFWLISGIPVVCSHFRHQGGRWWSIKPFVSTSAG